MIYQEGRTDMRPEIPIHIPYPVYSSGPSIYPKVIKMLAYSGQSVTSAASARSDPASVLAAATGGAGPLPIITTLLAEPIPVVSVTINTTSLAAPSILLTFTSIISLPLGISVTFNFQILRNSSSGTVPVGSTFTFSTLVDVLEAESFAFQFFDANLLPGVYTYTVQLSTNSIIDVTPGATINNATLSALAVG